MEVERNTDEIIHSYLEGTATETELLTLLNWIKLSKENVLYFNQLCNVWENAINVSDHVSETETALNKLNSRLQTLSKEHENLEVEEDSSRFMFLKIAVVAIVLTGLTISFYFIFTKSNKDVVSEYVTAIAPKSQKSQLILADGTKVWLNSGTTLKYNTDYGKSERQIYLDGEAYFEVATNPSKPFLVYASNIIVKALGTSFNVKCYSEDNTIETTLLEGKVQVSNNNGSTSKEFVLLRPNQRAIFSRLDNKLVIATDEKPKAVSEKEEQVYSYIKPKSIESVISWKNEELIFENEPFEELTKRLERWYNVEINVINPEVNLKNSYTGKFVHNESLEQVLKIISRTTPIKYSFIDGEVRIEAKSKTQK